MRRRILFVCVHNAGRSRMAAAFLNDIAGDRYEGLSAGTEPAERAQPEVVATMAEAGVELPGGPGTLLTETLADSAERVIGMGCAVAEACPALRVPLEDWGLPDPKGRPVEEVRVIRDTTRRLVERLVARLDTEAAVT
ncbi:MAG TPA: low molecular weight phosphatase family protein [Actinomycetes bacterium]|nr:low molecular weight phosphatase family protein [Actinomycetes bacterium]